MLPHCQNTTLTGNSQNTAVELVFHMVHTYNNNKRFYPILHASKSCQISYTQTVISLYGTCQSTRFLLCVPVYVEKLDF